MYCKKFCSLKRGGGGTWLFWTILFRPDRGRKENSWMSVVAVGIWTWRTESIGEGDFGVVRWTDIMSAFLIVSHERLCTGPNEENYRQRYEMCCYFTAHSILQYKTTQHCAIDGRAIGRETIRDVSYRIGGQVECNAWERPAACAISSGASLILLCTARYSI